MAILGTTSLIGCDSIPQFIDIGTIMVFHQSAAPASSWTKLTDTARNDIALRVIGGLDGSALSPFNAGSPFTTVFTSTKGLGTVPLTSNPAAITIDNASGYITSANSGSVASISGPGNISTATLRSHAHQYLRAPASLSFPASGVAQPNRSPAGTALIGLTSGGAGSSGGHGHGVSDGQHLHPMSPGIHNHTVTDPTHTHTFTMTQRNFDVTYVDIILCSKN
jgi:hypothetical protein